jgi:hypothetical protein
MTTTTAPAVKKGSTVYVLDPNTYGPSVRFPGAWTVEKVNQRTYKLSQPGRPGMLNCDKSLTTTEAPAAGVTVEDARFPWQQGQIVRWATAPVKAGGTLFVIISDKGDRTVERIVLLGNTDGRYWRRVPASQLEPVDVADILKDGVQR